jgi:type III pantothenate kinase
MKPAIVVDVGNSRLKWGRCDGAGAAGAVSARASLTHDDADAWDRQLRAWRLAAPLEWAVTGVHPGRRDRLIEWIKKRGDRALLIDAPAQLPLRVQVEAPERVGIDRLFDAVAANSRRRTDTPAVVIDAGSAVTVDWVTGEGAFAGGAIYPGLRLMAQALHDHTALLPLIEVVQASPPCPGESTPAAMEAGIFWAVVGGASALVDELCRHAGDTRAPIPAFLTGGDAPLLETALHGLPRFGGWTLVPWPEMTLEGIRLTADGLS